jgi:hypothetical protein
MMKPVINRRQRRRMDVTRLYVRGRALAEIVEELRLDESAVQFELTEIRKQWFAASNIERKEAKARELARIDHLESEAWRAWERSQRDSRRDKRVEKKGELVQSETTVQTRDGDPRYLSYIQRAIDLRTALLELIASSRNAEDDDGLVTLGKLLDEIAAEMAQKRNREALGENKTDG